MPQTPTDPTKAQVWVTGAAPNQQLEFYIPRGAKGEPGGIVLGTVLGTADLNSFFTPGTYRQTNGADATLLRNYPKANLTGLLNVFGRDGNVVVQQYMPIDGTSGVPTMYQRLSTSSTTWTAWRVFATSRVDQTAGRAIYKWDDLNNREQLVYGDTGDRDIAASHGNGTFAALKLRRVGYTCELVCVGWRPPADATANLLSVVIPSGFRAVHTHSGFVLDSANNVKYVTASGSMASIVIGGNLNANTYTFSLTYLTAEAWPTTLPGTASGSIPNL